MRLLYTDEVLRTGSEVRERTALVRLSIRADAPGRAGRLARREHGRASPPRSMGSARWHSSRAARRWDSRAATHGESTHTQRPRRPAPRLPRCRWRPGVSRAVRRRLCRHQGHGQPHSPPPSPSPPSPPSPPPPPPSPPPPPPRLPPWRLVSALASALASAL